MSRILIVEDEMHLALGLQFNLEAEGHGCQLAESAEAAMEVLAGSAFDCLILDVMLPGISGFELCAKLRREQNYVPVLMLTARGRPEDVVRGFEAGADDYLPKPFELPVLLARLKALLRRSRWMKSDAPAATGGGTAVAGESSAETVFEIDGRVVDLENLEIRGAEEPVRLTLMEADLLGYFLHHRGRVVSRSEILEKVWGLRDDTDTRAVDNFIVRLRKYLEAEPAKPRHLLTVRGVGYRFHV
jgi:DNA-binding response OmpR family regulator